MKGAGEMPDTPGATESHLYKGPRRKLWEAAELADAVDLGILDAGAYTPLVKDTAGCITDTSVSSKQNPILLPLPCLSVGKEKLSSFFEGFCSAIKVQT